jgi:Flp pilus assembly protein TadD
MHPPGRHSPLSPRRRRLRITLRALAVGLVTGVALLWLRNRSGTPAAYRPDEHPEDITSSLAVGLPPEAPRPRFSDRTRAAGLAGFRNFQGDRTSQLPEDMGPGLAWGDFDNDGVDDLFLVSAGGPLSTPESQLLPCALYRNLGDGTFRRVEEFPDTRIHGMAAAWGDYDGDGFLDLVVTGYNVILLFHNEGGTGRFVADPRIPSRRGFWAGAAWGDYDNDRSLDLYVCGYVQYVENATDRERVSNQISTAVPFTLNPASYTPGTNLLLHNLGNGSFREVATELHVTNPEGRSLSALWQDFDEDGWLDLYVANDISDNVLYHNLGGRFEDISHPALVADYRSAMGLAAGDYNRDGDDDLFITHWVAQENALYDNTWADFNRRTNSAPGTGRPYALRFLDSDDMLGLGQIALPYVGWGTEFVDFDGDGWPDLVVANGNTLEAEGPPPRHLQPQELFLFWNRRGQFFHNLAPLSPVLSERHSNRGLACADFDNDGAMDIAVAQLGEGVQLLRNEMQTGHWLKLRLRSRNTQGRLTGFGDGAKVIAWLGDIQVRRSLTSASYCSQSSHTLHFGLGEATRVDRLEVRWLGGEAQTIGPLQADVFWEVREGDPAPARVIPPPRSSGAAAAPAVSPTPTPVDATPAASTPNDRARRLAFWSRERAAMDAMKISHDTAGAIRLFREALELDPQHEDSRYYLGLCLATQGDLPGALAELQTLRRINPQSHRAWQQAGVLRAVSATSPAELAEAETLLERAHALNPEETGALLALGEVSLMRGDAARACQRLEAACQTNPKAAGGFFLRSYVLWKQGAVPDAERLLAQARAALGPEWKPRGATSEGDVHRVQHTETTPLTGFWQGWNGDTNPAAGFARLDEFLRTIRPAVARPVDKPVVR